MVGEQPHTEKQGATLPHSNPGLQQQPSDPNSRPGQFCGRSLLRADPLHLKTLKPAVYPALRIKYSTCPLPGDTAASSEQVYFF